MTVELYNTVDDLSTFFIVYIKKCIFQMTVGHPTFVGEFCHPALFLQIVSKTMPS